MSAFILYNRKYDTIRNTKIISYKLHNTPFMRQKSL